MFKVGIVGCGNIAGIKDSPRNRGAVKTHAQAYYRHPLFTIDVIVENNKSRLESFKNTWHIPRAYNSLKSMLKQERLDVISISTPDEHHFHQLIDILSSPLCPKVIFVEKPICRTRQEFQCLKEILGKKRCEIIVNHSRRFDKAYIRLSHFIRNNRLGKLLSGRFDYYGGWLHNGCHLVDTLMMIFNKNLKFVSSVRPEIGRGTESSLDVKLSLGRAKVDIYAFDESYYQLFEAEFRFEKGRVSLKDFGTKIYIEIVNKNKIGEKVLEPISKMPWQALDSALYDAVDSIGKFLKGQKALSKTGATFYDTESTMRILWEALEYEK